LQRLQKAKWNEGQPEHECEPHLASKESEEHG
jgi:hypothetical protein